MIPDEDISVDEERILLRDMEFLPPAPFVAGNIFRFSQELTPVGAKVQRFLVFTDDLQFKRVVRTWWAGTHRELEWEEEEADS